MKLLWTIMTVLSTVYCIIYMYDIAVDYYNYDVISITKNIQKNLTIFPAVTICTSSPNLTISNMLDACWFKFKPAVLTLPDFQYFNEFNHPDST
jgi:hypothetical protein